MIRRTRRTRRTVLHLTRLCGRFVIGTDALALLPKTLIDKGVTRCAVVVDSSAWASHRDLLLKALTGWSFHLVTSPATDSEKTLAWLSTAADEILEFRPHAVISFGGGIAMNAAGMLAALAYRGIPLFQVPTTLSGMIDVGPSIRHSVHSRVLRKALGLFLQSEAVLCDTRLLTTAPQRSCFDGFVEAIKTALVESHTPVLSRVLSYFDAGISNELDWCDFIELAVHSKLHAMRRDPSERRRGLCLHYGHTLGLAIEPLAPSLSHGEAVVYGMDFAGRLAERLRIMTPSMFKRHQWVMGKLLARTSPLPEIDIDNLLARLSHDAKVVLHALPQLDRLPFVLLKELGRPALESGLPLITVNQDVVRVVLVESMPFWTNSSRCSNRG